jgi:PAS domain S-box-containing protein
MKINTIVLSGFLFIIILISIIASINYSSTKEIGEDVVRIRDVEVPLEIMVEQIIGYDAMLTGNAHNALLYVEKGELEDVKRHEDVYNEIGGKMDNILKIEAVNLLEQSSRSEESKENVKNYLKRLDEVNINLVDLELEAFEKMKQGDFEVAYDLIVGGQYDEYKKELAQVYGDWADEEKRITILYQEEVIEDTEQINSIIRYSSVVLILLGLILSIFIARFISRPLKKITLSVDEITKGKLDIQLEKSNVFEVHKLTDSLNRVLASLKLAVLRTGVSKGELGLEEAVEKKEEAEKKYRILYESSRDAIMILEAPTWNFTAGNPATVKMFGTKDEAEFVSKSPGDLSPEKQPNGKSSADEAKKMIEKAMKDGSNSFDWVHKKVAGEEFPAKVLLTKMSIGGKDVLQATVKDLSGIKAKVVKKNVKKKVKKIKDVKVVEEDNEKKA